MEMLNDFCGVTRADGGVVEMTICNAGKANLLNTVVMDGLIAGMDALAQETTIRILILTSPEDRTFIGGADLREMAQLEKDSAERFISRLRDLCESVRHFPVPVVARISGWCLGGGLELAAACDIRVASKTSNFAMPEVQVGIPSVVHAALLPRLIGWGRARYMILTGAVIDANTALSWGLVDVVVPASELDREIGKVIELILKSGSQVMRAQKELLRRWEDMSLSDSISASISYFGDAFTTGEPKHFMADFFTKKAG
ncbi:enoyl-CoA hydratase [Tardiphaga sp.]|uniref:enoyl-CoA hydratase n=1 Tax=Tardiphaga sp. TaxID=1926292 RepID=UPI00262A0381|nr:enoyl-CoA hydratase [Tardiphaga sp.]MDB5616854.1 enoyl-CoA hydratase [Tardiphaga sp.]